MSTAPNRLSFTFSDLIAGYVVTPLGDSQKFTMRTSDGRLFEVKLGANLYAQMVRNLGEPWQDCTGLIRTMLVEGRFIYAYGIFYPEDDATKFEVKELKFVGRTASDYVFEKPSWWVTQINELGEFYLNAQFGGGGDKIDYRNYRTNLTLGGSKTTDHRQETDTISRLVYGFASAFHLTGREDFLLAAERGTQYLRDHMRFYDRDENIVYWYHGIDLKGGEEHKVFASEFGDDYYAIPAYEQIYALAGPVQTYRMTGDKTILKDAELTIELFKRFFRDDKQGGYFSHIDPVTLDPRAESLGHNRAKKNWNSVGDHAPAFLINLVLATGRKDLADFLVETGDTIADRFPDYENSPFVQEKFFEDWSKDQTWGWQQNRAVIGHNLKIAWNLMRINALAPKDKYVALARKIADLMPFAGEDRQRGGWYDVVERVLGPGEKFHRYAWHDRKAWWQQEQAILAYLILHGCVGQEEYLRHARESSAFYNSYFLDHQDGAVYFNVLANGIPFLMGTERLKGSHSMSGYHSFELAFLAATYTNLLVRKVPMDFFFMPYPGHLAGNKLNVAPDLLPKGSIRIAAVTVDGQPYTAFDAEALTVEVPADGPRLKFKVTIAPVQSAATS
ncbi:MAG: AGE family epimerase/isomerase [Opitutaceae bacterium]|nr:AGE family epimerase/isomerase [Opitutaceae bacterium]